MDWDSKENLGGLLVCTMKIVRRLILVIYQINEWRETGLLLDTAGSERIKSNSIRDRGLVYGCVFLQFLGAPLRKV